MQVKQSLFFVFILTISGVKSDDFVKIEGYTVDNPRDLTIINIAFTNNLKEDTRCHSLKTIEQLERFSTLRTDYISDLPNLERLTIKSITGIEAGAFRNVPKLTYIKIETMFLDEIREDVFNHLNVVELVLSWGSIKNIAPKAFDDLPKLEKIDLSFNELTYWNSDWFSNTPKLKTINFEQNKIIDLPNGAFKNIRNRDASINLNNNKIRLVGRRLFGWTDTIAELSLSGNTIEEFDENVLEGVAEMELLDLSYNRIECFNGNLSRILVAKAIFLFNNTLKCDCVRKIADWKAEHADRNISWSKIRCQN